MKLFYSPSYTCAAHGFDTTRKASWIVESLAEQPIEKIELAKPRPADEELLRAVHSPRYVDAVKTGGPRELAESQGFTWDQNFWDSVCASNGGAVEAALEALKTGVAGSLSTGMHHARKSRGDGYCTFNGLILATVAALEVGIKKVLIVDLDAHCSGGTHQLLTLHELRQVTLLDISTDRYDRYERKGGYSVRSPFIKEAANYLPTLESQLRWLSETDGFDLCIYNAGVDPHEDCHEGGLKGITRDMLKERDLLMFNWCKFHRIPIAFVIAGGYTSERLSQQALVQLHRGTLEAAIEYTK